MGKKAPTFVVYTRTSGGAYLTPRASGAGYRWVKNRAVAAEFSTRGTATRNARLHGGLVVEA